MRTNNSIRLFMPALAAILVALPIRADVLNVFSNGTAADANEVNQNFSDLNMRLDSLENSTTATVSANCTLEAPEALQDAIDAAPAHGLVINASGLCNSVTIFSKRNITINGPVQFISDGAGEAGRPLNIALSQSIFINDATADAVTGNERAVNVGASSVFFNNLVAKNSTDRDMSVNSKAVVFISGTSQIGDNNNLAPAGIELTEDSYISAGEDLTIKGTIGMFLRDGSLFAQDAAGSDANDLVIEGGAVVEGNSVLKLQNGSLNSFLFVGDSNAQVFVEGTQEFDLINAVVTADNGSITLNSAVTGGVGITLTGPSFSGVKSSVLKVLGTPFSFDPTAVVLNSQSSLDIAGNSVSVNANTSFSVNRFSLLESAAFIAQDKVSCDGNVIASYTTGSGTTDLCAAPPAP